MHNGNIHFEMLHIPQLSVDEHGLGFNIKRCASTICWLLIKKKIPFQVDPRGFLKWCTLLTIWIMIVFQYMRLVLSVIISLDNNSIYDLRRTFFV